MEHRAIVGPWLLIALAATASQAGPATYVVDPAASLVKVHVGKGGLFKFAGHEHDVLATGMSGHVEVDPERLGGSSVVMSFDAASLRVSEQGEPAGDAPKVQEKMAGPELLDVVHFPTIGFRSTLVAGKQTAPGVYDLEIEGELSLHGVARPLKLKLRVELTERTLTATGQTVLKQTDFGLKPISVAGVVKVKNEVEIAYTIVAQRQP